MKEVIMKVYLDNAATTPLRKEVLEAMLPFLTQHFGNPSSLHAWGQKAREAVENAREKVAQVLNCSPAEIYFTGTTTTSANIALQGVAKARKNEGCHLITTPIEHHAVLEVFQALAAEQNFKLSLMQVDQFGMVKPDDLDKLVSQETILISVMFANNEVGTVEPIAELGRKIESLNQKRKHFPRIYFHVDAATVAEYIKLDLQKLKIDLLTLGSHKFHGPKGNGILFVRKGIKIKPILFGGHHEHGLWPGTEDVAGIVGTAKALEIAQKEVQKVSPLVVILRDRLINGVLKNIPKAKLTGHPKFRLPDIASFTFEGAEGESILLFLDREGIAASSGSACTSGDLKPSHVLLGMGIPPQIAHSSIRFSLSYETTKNEVDYVIAKLPAIIANIRKMSPYGDDVSQKMV